MGEQRAELSLRPERLPSESRPRDESLAQPRLAPLTRASASSPLEHHFPRSPSRSDCPMPLVPSRSADQAAMRLLGIAETGVVGDPRLADRDAVVGPFDSGQPDLPRVPHWQIWRGQVIAAANCGRTACHHARRRSKRAMPPISTHIAVKFGSPASTRRCTNSPPRAIALSSARTTSARPSWPSPYVSATSRNRAGRSSSCHPNRARFSSSSIGTHMRGNTPGRRPADPEPRSRSPTGRRPRRRERRRSPSTRRCDR